MRPAPSSCAHKRLKSGGDNEMNIRYNIIIVGYTTRVVPRIIVTCRERSMLLFGSNEDVLPFCESAYVYVCVCMCMYNSRRVRTVDKQYSKRLKG